MLRVIVCYFRGHIPVEQNTYSSVLDWSTGKTVQVCHSWYFCKRCEKVLPTRKSRIVGETGGGSCTKCS